MEAVSEETNPWVGQCSALAPRVHYIEVPRHMRVVLQRVRSARVVVGSEIVGEIGQGLLVLLGVARNDTVDNARWLADKIVGLRIFEDDAGKMNRDVAEVGGSVLVVS